MSHNKTLPIILTACLIMLSACSSLPRTISEPFKGSTGSKGDFKVGNPYTIGGKRYTPQETYNFTQTGIASWYGPNFHGKRTANGEIYDQYALTAAHKTLQMPSIVRVTNLENGRSIIVRINDRGPFSRGRIIDMSSRGADLLQFKRNGTAKVKVQILPVESKAVAEAAKRGIDVSGVEIALNEGKGLDNRFATQEPEYMEPVAPLKTAQNEPVSLIEPVEVQNLNAPPPPQATQPTAPPPAHNIVKTVPVNPSNIFVQAGSFSSAENAQALATRLTPFGRAEVIPATINGQTFYRVRLAADNVKKADAILSNLSQNGHNQAIIIVE